MLSKLMLLGAFMAAMLLTVAPVLAQSPSAAVRNQYGVTSQPAIAESVEKAAGPTAKGSGALSETLSENSDGGSPGSGSEIHVSSGSRNPATLGETKRASSSSETHEARETPSDAGAKSGDGASFQKSVAETAGPAADPDSVSESPSSTGGASAGGASGNSRAELVSGALPKTGGPVPGVMVAGAVLVAAGVFIRRM